MARLLNAVPDARLTARKSRTSDQVATEPEAGFPEAEALRGAPPLAGDLRAGAFGVLFCRKKVPEKKLHNPFN